MAPTTRKEVFEHVLHTVLEQPKDDQLEKSLLEAGKGNIYLILSIADDEINTLTYTKEDKIVPLRKHEQGLIRVLQQYNLFMSTKGTPITDWMLVTVNDINQYRISPHFNAFISVPAANRTSASNVPPK